MLTVSFFSRLSDHNQDFGEVFQSDEIEALTIAKDEMMILDTKTTVALPFRSGCVLQHFSCDEGIESFYFAYHLFLFCFLVSVVVTVAT